VVRSAAATDADEADADVAGGDGELGHLEACEHEGVEGDREGVRAVLRVQ
jgi:hypothetical protein